MAQLEIQDPQGSTTFVELNPQKPILVGSSSKCDVTLKSPQVKKVHCRIVNKDGRWRIEVATDAPPVQLKDKSVKSGKIDDGDTITIGDWSISFREDDAADDPFDESDDAVPAAPTGAVSDAEQAENLVNQIVGDTVSATTPPVIPGEQSLIKSKLVNILLISLVVVAGAFIFFWNDYQQKQKQLLFDRGNAAMSDGTWEEAIELYRQFNELYPSDDRASAVRVRETLCEVHRATTPRAALAKARYMLDKQSKEIAFADASQNLGGLLRDIMVRQAEVAEKNSDRKAKDASEELEEFINSRLPGQKIKGEELDALEATRERAIAAIMKREKYEATLKLMEESIDSGKTFAAYGAYDELQQRYNDLAEKPAILDLLKDAADYDQNAIAFDSTAKSSKTEQRQGSAAGTTILLDRKGGADTAASKEVVYALANGAVVAFDADGGKGLWFYSVGADSRWLPISLDDKNVLLVDTRHDELVSVDKLTGKVTWRLEIGEPLETSPLVFRGRIYQPTGKGNLAIISSDSGRKLGSLSFGDQRLPNTPVIDRTGRFLYMLGGQYNLYAISLASPPKCEYVLYLGHKPDSVQASLLRLDRYLVICENNLADENARFRLRVLAISQDGTSLSEVEKQAETEIRGWVSNAPAVRGNVMMVANDQEDVKVYSSEGQSESGTGFKLMKNLDRGATGEGPFGQAFSIAYTDSDFLVAGQSIRHYHFERESSELTDTRLEASKDFLKGTAAQPIQQVPAAGNARLLFVAMRSPGSSAINFFAIDAQSLTVKWQVQLGSPLLSLTQAGANSDQLNALTQSGQLYTVPSDLMQVGGAVDQPTARLQIESDLAPDRPALTLPDGSLVYTPRGEANHLVVRTADSQMRRLDIPAPLTASPAVLGKGIVLPSKDGRIYWVDPMTGAELAEPFQPEVSLDEPPTWRGVTVSGNTIIAADSSGILYQIVHEAGDVSILKWKQGFERILEKPAASGLATLNGNICFVDEANKLLTFKVDGFEPIGSWDLQSRAEIDPLATGDYIFVVAGQDELVCIDNTGNLSWRHSLEKRNVVGFPTVSDGKAYLAFSDGVVHSLNLADGSLAWKLDVEKPLAGGIVATAGALIVPGGDGTLNVLVAPQQ